MVRTAETLTPAAPARYWHLQADGRLQCDLCPRECKLQEGQRGACFVRQRSGDRLVLTTYGRSSGFCIDPIEKKPLHHFYPGSSVLSFGTAGCNLACKFCQNWDITKSRDQDRQMDLATPLGIAQAALRYGCTSVAFTYNDPVIFAEYAMDVADACHSLGIHTVAVTAGYVQGQARQDFFSKIDAANIDLKAFTEDFYFHQTGSHLQPVLDTLLYLRHETSVWFEITTLLIPGLNDSEGEIAALCEWVRREMGDEVPLHFSAFHPDYKLTDIPATPGETLVRARTLACQHGLKHVYLGNVHHRDGDTSFCAACGTPLMERDWYAMRRYVLTTQGACPRCGTPLAGRFAPCAGHFGRQRIPVQIGC